MPYIQRERRSKFDKSIDTIVKELGTTGIIYEADKAKGDLNYVIFSIAKKYLDRGCSYSKINDIIGAIECCKHEIYRRLVAEYEDSAIRKNGDIV